MNRKRRARGSAIEFTGIGVREHPGLKLGSFVFILTLQDIGNRYGCTLTDQIRYEYMMTVPPAIRVSFLDSLCRNIGICQGLVGARTCGKKSRSRGIDRSLQGTSIELL